MPRQIDYQAQVVLDEKRPRLLIAILERGESGALRLFFQGRRQHVAPADVKNRRRLNAEDGKKTLPQESDLRFT